MVRCQEIISQAANSVEVGKPKNRTGAVAYDRLDGTAPLVSHWGWLMVTRRGRKGGVTTQGFFIIQRQMQLFESHNTKNRGTHFN